MKHFQRHPIAKYTTLKVGGYADNFYIPNDREELTELIQSFGSHQFLLLGNGSNIFIKSKRIKKPVLMTNKSLKDVDIDATTGKLRVGAGVDIRKMIADCLRVGLRAPVELLTIPATVGGAVYMNAGRTSMNSSISDNLIEVEVFDGKHFTTLSRKECTFSHRYSVFHRRPQTTILSATFQYDRIPSDVIQSLKRTSIEAAKDKDYRNLASAGSVFKKCDYQLMQSLRGTGFRRTGFARNTPNCIVNYGDAYAWQISALLAYAYVSHRLRGKQAILEWQVW
ncbi:FAD-binding protein [Allorhodopirellula heiligendammensis]|uniref:UDP-N-acetylenolpyruvoylglucosamine reductase n=1 Tax=Allorhodopirellula heiligendammensis TaxID=2714739 RepID=A0A5C6C246_9BACT|nr:FAD-binding protein [Allorhodopirellula heiligendammensis]TWU18067.1 UDP-N-acetylenolpyruvoylglucosamine reductase [Allorhodopirellula heiligendammensis]|tara:strand:- start:722 stop:1564 length:843 start_codon:yes stop_codon:yes gene_type:complete